MQQLLDMIALKRASGRMFLDDIENLTELFVEKYGRKPTPKELDEATRRLFQQMKSVVSEW